MIATTLPNPNAAFIDGSKSITRGLRGLFFLNSRGKYAVNLARPNSMHSLASGVIRPYPSPWGLVSDFDGTNDRFTVDETTGSWLRMGNIPITIMAAVRVDTVGGVIFATSSAGTGTNYAGFFGAVSTALSCGYGNNTGQSAANRRSLAGSAATITAGVWYVVGISMTGTITGLFTIDGKPDAITTSGSASSYANATRVAEIPGQAHNSVPFDGQIAWMAIWNRGLNLAEQREVAGNVYGLLGHDRIVLPEPAGQTVDAATALLALTPSGSELRESIDAATVPLALVPSGSDVHTGAGTEFTDSGTAQLTLTPSAAETAQYVDADTARLSFTPGGSELKESLDSGTERLALTPSGSDLRESLDSATARLTLTPDTHDCVVTLAPDFEVTIDRKYAVTADRKWQADDLDRRWSAEIVMAPVTC